MRMRLRDWTFLMGMMDFCLGKEEAKVLTMEKSKLAAKKVLERRSNKVRNQTETDDMMLCPKKVESSSSILCNQNTKVF